MLVKNSRHERWHSLGPKDCYFDQSGGLFKKGKAVASIRITRSTISDEQFEVIVPVFSDDSRESLDDRLGMFLSLAQDRREDAAKAWDEAEDNQEHVIEQVKVKAGLLTEEQKKASVEAKKPE